MSRNRHSTDIRSVDKNLDKHSGSNPYAKNICCFEYHLHGISSYYYKFLSQMLNFHWLLQELLSADRNSSQRFFMKNVK